MSNDYCGLEHGVGHAREQYTAIWNMSPDLTSWLNTTRLGILKPWIVAGLGRPAARGRAPLTQTSAQSSTFSASTACAPDGSKAPRRDCQTCAKPEKRHPSAAALGAQRSWGNRWPGRVVEAVFTGVRLDVIGGGELRYGVRDGRDTSMIFASFVFYCAPKSAEPSWVIRSTAYTGGSSGAMAGSEPGTGADGASAVPAGGAPCVCALCMLALCMLAPSLFSRLVGPGRTALATCHLTRVVICSSLGRSSHAHGLPAQLRLPEQAIRWLAVF